MDYKKLIAERIKLENIAYEEIYAIITVPIDPANGDYCLPCFKFSKILRKSPQQIAEEIKAAFDTADANSPLVEGCLKGGVVSVETVSGYVNFRLDRTIFIKEAMRAAENRTVVGRGLAPAGQRGLAPAAPMPDGLDGGSKPPPYGTAAATSIHSADTDFLPYPPLGKTVCIDYSSVNIAKPFHIGHLLTTAIGGSLYRIYRYLGYNVVGINHLGDWGTQFGKLIAAYKRWGGAADIDARGITALNELYVKFHAEAEKDKTLEDEGRAYFKLIEQGDAEAHAIFERFKAVTMREVEKVYARLGITFDSYNGESFYNDKMSGIVELLQDKNLLSDSDGAKVVDLEPFGMPPCLILKSDGASLYATRDLAAALYRKQTYNFDKNLYVVAYQQNLHFAQVFKVLELCGFPWAADCAHVPFGMVSLEGAGALSTRKGNVVYLKDVLDTAVQKTMGIIEQKNPELADKEKTAEAVGVGAVVFMALSTARIKDLVFSYDKALNFDGETGPYLQYTHARCCSVLEKCRIEGPGDNEELGIRNEEWRMATKNTSTGIGDRKQGLEKYKNSATPHSSPLIPNSTQSPSTIHHPPSTLDDLTDDAGFELVKLIARFDQTVESAAERYEPSILARYLIDVAQSFNRYYIGHRIIGDANREKLTALTRSVLKNGLNLLLINAPEKM